MRSLTAIFALTVALAAGVSFVDGQEKDKKAPSLDGIWIMTSVEVNGEKKLVFDATSSKFDGWCASSTEARSSERPAMAFSRS